MFNGFQWISHDLQALLQALKKLSPEAPGAVPRMRLWSMRGLLRRGPRTGDQPPPEGEAPNLLALLLERLVLVLVATGREVDFELVGSRPKRIEMK